MAKSDDSRLFENSQRLMTYREVADYLGVTVRVLYKWADKGKLTKIELSPKCVRFEPEEVRKLGRQEG